jgi:hypothetical protein
VIGSYLDNDRLKFWILIIVEIIIGFGISIFQKSLSLMDVSKLTDFGLAAGARLLRL